MANINVGVGGAWKEVTSVSVGVGGAWKQATSMWVGVGGAWKKVWDYLSVAVPATLSDEEPGAISPTDAVASFTVNSDGTYSSTPANSAAGTWLQAGAAADVEVRLTQTGLTGAGAMSGATLATWLACSTTRTWTLTNTTNGFNLSTFTGTLEFRNAATTDVLDTATLTLTANTEA